MRPPIRYAGIAKPVKAPEAYGWGWLLAPVVLALELALLVVLTGHHP